MEDKVIDVGQTDDKDYVVNDRRHAQREAKPSKEEKQVWMQFEGRSRLWDVRCDEGGDEMVRKWREEKRMEGVGMHMVSEGRVVDWNDIYQGSGKRRDGASYGEYSRKKGENGERRRRKRVILGSRMEDLGRGVRRRNNSMLLIRRRSWKNIERCWETNTLI